MISSNTPSTGIRDGVIDLGHSSWRSWYLRAGTKPNMQATEKPYHQFLHLVI